MIQIFTIHSPYKKQARFVATLWTLLIFIGCFMPGKDLPKVDVRFIDKWVHIVLFAGFSFLWLCARPLFKLSWLFSMFLIATALGGAIELLQGALPALGRACELLDAVADSVGALCGILVFSAGAAFARSRP